MGVRKVHARTHTRTCQCEMDTKKIYLALKKKAKRTLHETSDGANYIAYRWVDAEECGVFRWVAESWRTSHKTHKDEIHDRKPGNRGHGHSWI